VPAQKQEGAGKDEGIPSTDEKKRAHNPGRQEQQERIVNRTW
jgi:hypothetical protein